MNFPFDDPITSEETVVPSRSLAQWLQSSDEEEEQPQPLPQRNDEEQLSPTNRATSGINPSAEEQLKYGPLFAFGIDDVKMSELEDQPTQKGTRNVPTCLIGIGNIKTVDITTKHLRNWGLREKMGTRNGTKTETCVAVVAFVKNYRRMKERGVDTQQPEQQFARSKINFIRAINVLSEETFKAKLAFRRTQIGRAELDEGIQADEDLWKDFASIYNNGNNSAVGEIKYTIEWHGATPDPTSFTTITWTKAERTFKDMSAKYDSAHKAWKQSGFHDEFETIPFANFASNRWLVYLHEFLQENPGLLKVVTCDLAEGTHVESGTGMSDDEAGTTPTAASAPPKRKRKDSGGKKASIKKRSPKEDSRDTIFRSIAESSAKSAIATQKKSEAISYSALSIAQMTSFYEERN